MDKRKWIRWMFGAGALVVAIAVGWYVSWRRDPLRQVLYKSATAVSRYRSVEVTIHEESHHPERGSRTRTDVEIAKVPGAGAHAVIKTEVREGVAEWQLADSWELWSNGVEEVRHRLDMPEVWVAGGPLGCYLNRIQYTLAALELIQGNLCFEKTFIGFGGSSYLLDPGLMVIGSVRESEGRYLGKESFLGRPASRIAWGPGSERNELVIDDEFGVILSWRNWFKGELHGSSEVTSIRFNQPIDPAVYKMPDLTGKNVVR